MGLKKINFQIKTAKNKKVVYKQLQKVKNMEKWISNRTEIKERKSRNDDAHLYLFGISTKDYVYNNIWLKTQTNFKYNKKIKYIKIKN